MSLIAFFVGLTTIAQQIKTVEGYARMEQPDDKTAAEIKAKVVERAKINALIATFGTNISQNNNYRISNTNGKSTSVFNMFGESDLRGTWIRDIKQPRTESHIEEGRIIWEAWVKGEARKVSRAKVEFEWKLLANGIDDRYQVEELHDGDSFYVKFRSPVQGFLMLFWADDTGNVACMLPEEGQDCCKIDANNWMFFRNNNDNEQWIATMTKDNDVEYDQLYVVFSPNKIYPPTRTVNSDNEDLNRYELGGYTIEHVSGLTYNNFHQYLGKLLTRDTEVQIEKMIVKISNRKNVK